MNDKTFQKNLSIWAKSCPKEAVMLPYVDCNCFEICETEKGELNLKRLYGSAIVYYHSPKGAAAEAEEWFRSLPLNDISLLIVYGVGLGYYYDAAAEWLKQDRKRHIVFLEDDLAVIHKLLESERGTHILQDSQVQLLYFRNLKDEEGTLETLYWNFVLTRIAVSALGSYALKKCAILDQLRHKIAHDAAIKNALVDEYMRYGGAFFINFYKNMLCIGDSYLGNRFFGKFCGVPAIICGAGPSLAKNVTLLGALLDKALVFAGGSALNVLNAASFQPHFGAGIDPNPMQLARLNASRGYEVPFFYRNRMFHDAFRMIHGPRLYITGSGGYDISEFFEEKFKIKAEFLDEGHNVVNFCVQVAHEMGCNPIIFVGMDLAFTGMKEYAPGVVEDSTVNQTAILNIEEEDDKALIREDIFGKPVYTLWKWIAESEWLGDFAKEHPQVSMINCTEGGLGFPGVPNETLEDVAKRYLIRSYELKNRVHGEIQNSKMSHVTYRKVVNAMKELSKGLEKTITYFDVLLEESDQAIAKIKEGDGIPSQTGKAALAEIELSEEPAYKYVVDIFNAVYSRVLNRDLHQINIGRYSEKQRTMKKLALNNKKLKFLRDVAKINEELIGYAFRERKALKKGVRQIVEIIPTTPGIYSFENGKLLLNDPEMGLKIDEKFDPIMVPSERVDGKQLEKGHVLRVFYDKNWKLYECYVEFDGRPDGQCLLFYASGKVKEETFYRLGKLHGPVTFFSEDGQVLAKSWFIDGKQVGKSWWYYHSGAIYSIQRYRKNVWDGLQEFYYEDGTVKSLLPYKNGTLADVPILLQADGSPEPARNFSEIQVVAKPVEQ